MEQWREIPDFPDYTVSSIGRVRRQHLLSPGGPSRFVVLCAPRRRRQVRIAKLVEEHFARVPETEMWKPIRDFPGYEVSSTKLVRKTTYLTPHENTSGHFWIRLSKNNKPKVIFLHRLVAKAFLPAPAATSMIVMHKDHDAAHNAARNLRWGTRKENIRHSLRDGNYTSNQKLFASDVRFIRAKLRAGVPIYRIRKLILRRCQVEINDRAIRDIRNGKRWEWLS